MIFDQKVQIVPRHNCSYVAKQFDAYWTNRAFSVHGVITKVV